MYCDKDMLCQLEWQSNFMEVIPQPRIRALLMLKA